MTESNILGIEFNTLVNLGVAIGTLLLAYFTYNSVKTSKIQLDLLKKQAERPRVLEILQNTLIPLQSELEGESGLCKRRGMVWNKKNDENNLYLGPLSFPLSPKKSFYTAFCGIFFGVPKYGNIEVLVQECENNLNLRFETYSKLNEQIKTLTRRIENSNLKENMVNLFSELHFCKVSQIEEEKSSITSEHGLYGNISHEDLQNIIISMIVSAIFHPLEKSDLRLGGLGFTDFVEELKPHINSLITQYHADNWPEKVEIEKLLDKLSVLDIESEKKIKKIIEIYRNEYYFTDCELFLNFI